MASALYEVTFLVRVDTLPGEVVCVVGNHPSLGDWSARKAKRLMLQSKGESDVWTTAIKLPADMQVNYRYFCCRYFDSEDDGEAPNMIVTRWETNLRPRTFVPKAYCLSADDCQTLVAEFGRYGGKTSIDKGWLVDQTEVQLYLHTSPIKFWKKRHQDQTYRVKCTPLDLKQKEAYFPTDEAEESCDFNIPVSSVQMEVAVLTGRFEGADMKPQDQFGNVYREGDFLVFKAQTFETEYLGFCLDFYVHEENQGPGDIPKHVGFAHILPNIFQETIGSKTVPLSGLKHKPIGQVSYYTSCYSPQVLTGRFEGADMKPQDQFGNVYREGDFLVFKAQTFETEYLGFCLDFYVHEENQGPGDIPKHVGFAHILPNIFQETIGSKTVPLSGLKHKPIGQVSFQFLVIKPLKGYDMDMSVSYSRHWKQQRRALDVGHRGMGPSYSKQYVESYMSVSSMWGMSFLIKELICGADFVEFDVQLSKDHVPVVYHDLRVCLTLKKKHGKEIDMFHIPVRELTLQQLQSLKLSHPAEVKEVHSDHDMETVDPLEHQPFPTLQQLFETLDEHIGFNIEVKYAMQLRTGTYEEDQVHYTERNHYIDHILQCILDNAGSRRIILSCFDPNVCTMLRKKQNKYPVLFLTMGETDLWEPYDDKRTLSIPQASEFALCEEFLGVNVHSEDLLKTPNLVNQVKEAGLVLFCWGEDNNNSSNIAYLKELGVNGLIYDRISDYKPTKENVFKMEKEAKLKLLKEMGAIRTSHTLSGSESGSSSPEHSSNNSPAQTEREKLTRLSSLQEVGTTHDRETPSRSYSITSQRNV
ncbi:glycerophosphocholine phosphodiesterase GPCPD1 [Lingula anatina]|uniref:Glycerophosphocholine phosphodiesterase GPCPD1 n=2 Tax=Lingula anatina TaxID=7574 RepID=A0A2R2MIG7_LINAN|nr:glycerophosphocholine phosphodiesterase GPCPD1 [Lingula anatina]|eukprot:XP_023930021.1 glycerophosphocholine phosphodiesterase GPCPD1 [Lingula anatina]